MTGLGHPAAASIIGEVALAHDGSLGLAHAFIDAIADAGADAVKFQTHIAAAESTPAEPFRVKFSRQDATRYDYWKRMEFTEEQWRGLAGARRERGVLFISLAVLARGGRPAASASACRCGRSRPARSRNVPLLDACSRPARRCCCRPA